MNGTTLLKHDIKRTVFLASIIFLAACSIRKEQAGSQSETDHFPLVGTYWKLIEIKGTPVDTGLLNEPHIRLIETDHRVVASGGCNSMGGTYEIKSSDRLSFSQLIATMMACPNMEVEAALRDVLGQTERYAIEGDTLLLIEGRKTPLARFVATPENQRATIIVLPGNHRAATVLNGTWTLDFMDSAGAALDALFPNGKPTITFDTVQGRVSGSGGCNRYSGGIRVDGQAISFGEIASTRMYCEGVQEDAYFQTLHKVEKFRVNEEGTTLHLIMDDMAIMRFSRE